ncbi:MAG: DegT/DnrJ/EryC1/StrS family aminotransferase [Phycisphaerales bacterium]|nr:DegT/DnrJ/EryC1/StrS family aminotransferase [Phycisphaerales bacterium]
MSQEASPVAPAIPHFELATQWQLIKNDVESAIKEVLESQQYTSGAVSGPFIGRFEANLSKFLNAHAIALSSGTDAILAALMALGIKRGHEVITTPFTFFATAGCISRSGAKPVFIDIDPNTFLMNLAAIGPAVTRNTRAILPVHLFGQMMDTAALLEFADAHHLDVIEDAAQCIGAVDPKGKQVAENARCACLSFYPTKNLGAAGDAGALVTRDEKLATRFMQTRQHGEVTRYHHEFVGGNFRMDALQAAVLNAKLDYLPQWTERRRQIAAYYTRRFKGTDVKPPVEIAGSKHVYHQYVIRAPRRDHLRDHLTKQGIGCNIFYPKCLHLQQCFADLGYKKGQFPMAERATQEVLALPVYPELTDAQIERIATTVLAFYRR